MAIVEARQSAAENGIPIGSVLSRTGEVVGRGRNRRVQHKDPTAHAEIECIRAAGRIGSFTNTTLVSTLTPCFMCAGAVVQFKIPRVVVLDDVNFAGAINLMESHNVEVEIVRDRDVISMMAEFIRQNPHLWSEDVGQLA